MKRFSKGPRAAKIGSCIPNLNSKFWVSFRVGTSFRESRRDKLSVIFFVKMEIAKKHDYWNSRKWKTQKNAFFHNFLRFFTKIRVRTSWNKFSRVEMSSVKARKTHSNPNFWKTLITETRENENFGKNRLSQGLMQK